MSDQPTGGNTSFLGRKVGGVPVLYIFAAVAVILAVLAWQTLQHKKAANTNTTGGEPTPEEIAAATPRVPAIIYGSVSSDPAGQKAADYAANSSIKTNDEWLSRSVSFLISKGKNPGDAQVALQTYMNGKDLSFEQGQMRDLAVTEYGLPPGLFDSGITAPKAETAKPITNPRRDAINNFFQTYLGRPADANAQRFYDSQNMSINEIENSIANSDEAKVRRGETPSLGEQVKEWYPKYLGRQATTSEINYQVNSGLNPQEIEANIAGSEEAKTWRAASAAGAQG